MRQLDECFTNEVMQFAQFDRETRLVDHCSHPTQTLATSADRIPATPICVRTQAHTESHLSTAHKHTYCKWDIRASAELIDASFLVTAAGDTLISLKGSSL